MSRDITGTGGHATRPSLRVTLGAAVVAALVAGLPGTASAVPPPPPNPSDSELQAAGAAERAQAGQVGVLVNQLTEAEAQLQQLGDDIELRMELANKALVDLQVAQDAAASAQAERTAAGQQVTVAEHTIEVATQQGYDFAAASYQQGSTVGSFSAYLGSDSPEDVLARAQMLAAVGDNQLGVMDAVQRARTQQANAASVATSAQRSAEAAEGGAQSAKVAADNAQVQAQSAQATQAEQTVQLQGQRDSAQAALDTARASSAGLAGQRAAFQSWDSARLAEEEAARAAAEAAARAEAEAAARAQAAARVRVEAAARTEAEASARAEVQARAEAQAAARSQAPTPSRAATPSPAATSSPAQSPAATRNQPEPSGGGGSSAGGGGSSAGGPARSAGGGGAAAPAPPPAASYPPPTGASVQSVIDRALSQLGVRYSWGGGDKNGPTVGIRDGGRADSFGDYRNAGFDCSGLMIYAFAGVKSLPHYSGYQYTSGRQVPTSQMQPGDMVFYSPGGIHHVALYIGDGQMVEAPQSGSVVKVSPLRTRGLMPYVTRLF